MSSSGKARRVGGMRMVSAASTRGSDAFGRTTDALPAAARTYFFGAPVVPSVAATFDSQWQKLTTALRYGYTHAYALQVEGITTLLTSVELDADAPTGYTIEPALVVEGSGKLGSVVDEDTHIGRAFDLEARLLDSAAVRAIFARPSRFTRLRSDLTATATSIAVDDCLGWSSSVVHVGTSGESGAGYMADSVTVTRGTYGRKRSYKAGAVVTDGPWVWKGRRVQLWLFLIDPCGRVVQTSGDALGCLSQACAVFDGYIYDRPRRERSDWVLQARDQVRKLAQPLGTAASGKAVWSLVEDELIIYPTTLEFSLSVSLRTSGSIVNFAGVRPFASTSGAIRRSQARQLIVDAFTAATTDPIVLSYYWRLQDEGSVVPQGVRRNWELVAIVNPAAGDDNGRVELVQVSGPSAEYLFQTPFSVRRGQALEDTAAADEMPLSLLSPALAGGPSLAVIVDDGDPSALPSSGTVIVEAEDGAAYFDYSSVELDDTDPSKVYLQLAAPITPDLFTRIVSQETGGEEIEASVRFLWRSSGVLADVARRAIVSTGDAQHGAFDTLAKGQGLGLPNIDSASFAEVFDEAFIDLQFDFRTDAGQSLEELVGGVLKLSRRAIVGRRADDGTTVDLAAIDVGSADDGAPSAAVNERTLAFVGGRKPIRPVDQFVGAEAIKVTCHTPPIDAADGSEGVVTLRDQHLTDWTDDAWELDIYGVSRREILEPAKGWALSIFRAGETRQVVEIDIVPWLDVQAGDVVELDLTDPHLFDYAVGTPGLTGLARVLGAQVDPATLVTTILVAADGVFSAGPMSPSLPISAVVGGATTPTAIDVDEAYYALLAGAKAGESTWSVLTYLPGEDGGRALYTVSTVGEPSGGLVRLTVSGYPSGPAVSLSTSYRLTWPVSSACTATQTRYLHTDQSVQWS